MSSPDRIAIVRKATEETRDRIRKSRPGDANWVTLVVAATAKVDQEEAYFRAIEMLSKREEEAALFFLKLALPLEMPVLSDLYRTYLAPSLPSQVTHASLMGPCVWIAEQFANYWEAVGPQSVQAWGGLLEIYFQQPLVVEQVLRQRLDDPKIEAETLRTWLYGIDEKTLPKLHRMLTLAIASKEKMSTRAAGQAGK